MDNLTLVVVALAAALIIVILASRKKIALLKARVGDLEAFHDRYKDISDAEAYRANLTRENDALRGEIERAEAAKKKADDAERRAGRLRELYNAIKRATENDEPILSDAGAPLSFEEITSVAPVDVQAMSIRDLRARYNGLKRDVNTLVASSSKRYTTKANAAIYALMVMGLEAELQNILYTMKYGRLHDAELKVKQLTAKYYQVAADGNQTIAPTLTRFIKEIEELYLQIVATEYEYYVKREAAKEQQRALREQMRQEAEERKRLEAERRKVEAEKKKYLNEIDRLNAAVAAAASEEERAACQARLDEIANLMDDLTAKEDEIVRLQNGKAGTVYIISNVGSFGEDVYKIGMTRRLEPQERIDELGSASVPFPFDVHSFIFSEDAPALESRLHHELNACRINKVNLRKEFFRVEPEELRQLVERIDPSAIFTLTAAAEQFRQSLSLDAAVELDGFEDDDEGDEEDAE